MYDVAELMQGNIRTEIEIHKRNKEDLEQYRKQPESTEDEHTRKLIEINNKLQDEIVERKAIEEKLLEEKKQSEEAYIKLKKAYEESRTMLLHLGKMACIGRLAAGVAHEINNPVGFVSSNLGTLRKYVAKLNDFINFQTSIIKSLNVENAIRRLEEMRKDDKLDFILDDIKAMIKESLDGTDCVTKIVQHLKGFARTDEAEYKQTADINKCIESTLNIVWNELKYKAVVKKEYGQIPLIKCYPQQLSQVFMNILVNAAQAIDKQGEITIRTRYERPSVFVSISDTGCGIPKEHLDRIFDPFFTTKEVGQGTGLGLNIACEIIKRHNGKITVQSEVNKGTTFVVCIPDGNSLDIH